MRTRENLGGGPSQPLFGRLAVSQGLPSHPWGHAGGQQGARWIILMGAGPRQPGRCNNICMCILFDVFMCNLLSSPNPTWSGYPLVTWFVEVDNSSVCYKPRRRPVPIRRLRSFVFFVLKLMQGIGRCKRWCRLPPLAVLVAFTQRLFLQSSPEQ